MAWTIAAAPNGFRLLVEAGDAALRRAHFLRPGAPVPADWRPEDSHNADPLLRQAVLELEAYFARRLRAFTLPLRPEGTPFQQRVWSLLGEIPYGATRTYLDLAHALGRPGGARAVGGANAANPLPVFVPCHRVLASGGALGGYSGGLDIKRWLLDLEGAAPGVNLELPLM